MNAVSARFRIIIPLSVERTETIMPSRYQGQQDCCDRAEEYDKE